jgi:hypothetical protein
MEDNYHPANKDTKKRKRNPMARVLKMIKDSGLDVKKYIDVFIIQSALDKARIAQDKPLAIALSKRLIKKLDD